MVPCHTPYARDLEHAEGVTRFGNGLTTFCPYEWSHDPYAQVPRQLGAGVPLIILRFAPLAWLHPVLGFHALKCM
jgi:hypothetical protein